tara:strand:+ start:922 stop:2016 length:1095 start_codon:yes stop_codon:yes gene_type:complete
MLKKIAFIKFAGLAAGGCEKYLQNIACILSNSQQFEVDYYYTNAAPYINWSSPFIHPDNDESRQKIMEDHQINLIKVDVQNKDGSGPPYEWINTNFWELFDENQYDYVSSARSGYPEYPFHLINKTKIIDTIHGQDGEDKVNISKVILLCEWQAKQWSENGGNIAKATVIPTLVKVPPKTPSLLRQKLSIPSDAFVYGFHQGDREDIYSPVSLEAYNQIKNENNYFIIMGASEQHRKFAEQINCPHIKFIDFSSCVNDIHDFLGGIDVFAHARNDGEVCSAAIIEALYHGKPVISHPAMNMGHQEQIEGCGKMVYSVQEYAQEMLTLEQNDAYYQTLSLAAEEKYTAKYSYTTIRDKILQLYKT